MAINVKRKGLLILLLTLTGGSTTVWAQAPALPASAVTTAAPAGATEIDAGAVRLLVGRSTVLDVGATITRVSLTSADVADALVTAPHQLLINGKNPGTISMFVWDRGGALKRYEVIVQRDLARLSEQIKQLFPGEKIEVQSNGKNVVLNGTVSSKDMIEKLVNVAAGYVDKREEVVTLLQLSGTAPSNQVLLRVRFAEVSRSALTELGATWFTSPTGVNNTLARVGTNQFPGPGFDNLSWTKESGKFGADVTSAQGEFTFSDFLNFFLFSQKYDIGTMIKALQTRGVFQSLAEPNLVAESGKEASFLAGGEFPIPIAQGSGASLAISVVFKEFGIRLNFTPTVNGDRVHLKVKPEVSTLDFANGVVLQGFRIPALTTRRTETELELQNGQTFAIAGLMNNSVSSTMQKVPGIGDIPILGLLFRSKAAQKNQTELVVMITPIILANNSNGVTGTLPRTPEQYMPPVPEQRTHPQPPAAFTGPRPSADLRPAAPGAAPAAANTAGSTSSANAVPANVAPLPPAARPADAPAATAKPAAAARPSVESQKAAEEKSRAEAQAYARAKAAEGRRIAEQQALDKKRAEKEREQQEKAAREQAKKDAEAARRAQEAAKKQAEIDRERQKSIDEAAARLKAAEAQYQAEVAKTNKP
jgi:pilus assembly protein CpaC